MHRSSVQTYGVECQRKPNTSNLASSWLITNLVMTINTFSWGDLSCYVPWRVVMAVIAQLAHLSEYGLNSEVKTVSIYLTSLVPKQHFQLEDSQPSRVQVDGCGCKLTVLLCCSQGCSFNKKMTGLIIFSSVQFKLWLTYKSVGYVLTCLK